eukprot:Clim_evm46s142 gene=Clim_evmTU46s142
MYKPSEPKGPVIIKQHIHVAIEEQRAHVRKEQEFVRRRQQRELQQQREEEEAGIQRHIEQKRPNLPGCGAQPPDTKYRLVHRSSSHKSTQQRKCIDGDQRYQILDEIGDGAFGKVFKVRYDPKDGHPPDIVAVKKINVASMTREERSRVLLEGKILSVMKHPFIIRFRSMFYSQDKQSLYLCMELAPGGDIWSAIRQRRRELRAGKETYFDEGHVKQWMIQLGLGLEFVHSLKVLHRDIKTQNVFINSKGIAKIGDFGISTVLSNTKDLACTVVGTPYYLSPELCERKSYSFATDIWSMGCVFYEMMSLKHAFSARDIKHLLVQILTGKYPPLPHFYSRQLREVVYSMLAMDQAERPSIRAVCKRLVLRTELLANITSQKQHQRIMQTPDDGKANPKYTPDDRELVGERLRKPSYQPKEPQDLDISEPDNVQRAFLDQKLPEDIVDLLEMVCTKMGQKSPSDATVGPGSLFGHIENIRLLLERRIGMYNMMYRYKALSQGHIQECDKWYPSHLRPYDLLIVQLIRCELRLYSGFNRKKIIMHEY